MPSAIRDDCFRHIIRQIHIAEPTIANAISVGYSCLVPDEDFIQWLEILIQLQVPIPTPDIALGLEEPPQLWKPLQEETLCHPVLLDVIFII